MTATNTDFPAWYYDPETKQGQIFQTADDVPDGWVDHPGKAPEAPARKPMTRGEVIDALKDGGIEFDAKLKAADLYDLLATRLEAALTARGITFEPNSDARDLLNLLG